MNVAQRTYGVPEPSPTYEVPCAPPSGVVPRAVLRPEALSYHHLRPGSAGPADLPLLGEAYRCWREVWKATLMELDSLPDVPSDEFTRQDEIGALFHDFECVGMTGFRWVDASKPMFQDDSYFKIWSGDALSAARQFGPRVCILSNLTVAVPWRSARGVRVMDLVAALSLDRFLASDGDVAVATPRCDRGVNRLCYRLGFRTLAAAVPHHGVKVDLVGFHRSASERLFLSSRTEDVVRAVEAK